MNLDGLALSIVICVIVTMVLAIVEVVYQSKARLLACVGMSFLFYASLLSLGNVATTLLASIAVKDKLPESLSLYSPFFYAFFGIFAFEGILRNTNISIFDRGVLTIQDWIIKARDPAVANAVKKQAQIGQDTINKSAEYLKGLPENQLNTYIVTYLGANTVTEIEATAAATGADRRLYKALELATKAPDQTASILKISKKNNK